jgi:uncharacterized membrane protein
MDRGAHETLEERLLHRLLFFSDAVFAIVLTLLVLELRPPEGLPAGEVDTALTKMLWHVFSFAMSFALVAIFWLAHMSTTSVLRRFDWPTTVVNFAFLFPICLIPFVSAWFGGGPNNAFTWNIYCWVLVATSAGNVALVLVSSRDNGRLVGGVTPRQRVHRAIRAASPGMAFAIGLALLAFGELRISQYCWLAIGPFLWLERRFLPAEPKPKSAKPAPRRRPGR